MCRAQLMSQCIDASSVTNCGGCDVGPHGLGYDCREIWDADVVRCLAGRCVVGERSLFSLLSDADKLAADSCVEGLHSSNRSLCIGEGL
jgi:hypothetical protein